MPVEPTGWSKFISGPSQIRSLVEFLVVGNPEDPSGPSDKKIPAKTHKVPVIHRYPEKAHPQTVCPSLNLPRCPCRWHLFPGPQHRGWGSSGVKSVTLLTWGQYGDLKSHSWQTFWTNLRRLQLRGNRQKQRILSQMQQANDWCSELLNPISGKCIPTITGIKTMDPSPQWLLSTIPARDAVDTKYSFVTCAFPSHFVRSAENRSTFCGFHDWTAKTSCFQRFCMVSTPEQSSAPPQRRSRLGPGCPGDAFRLPGYRIRWSVRFVLNVFYSWCFVLSGTYSSAFAKLGDESITDDFVEEAWNQPRIQECVFATAIVCVLAHGTEIQNWKHLKTTMIQSWYKVTLTMKRFTDSFAFPQSRRDSLGFTMIFALKIIYLTCQFASRGAHISKLISIINIHSRKRLRLFQWQGIFCR